MPNPYSLCPDAQVPPEAEDRGRMLTSPTNTPQRVAAMVRQDGEAKQSAKHPLANPRRQVTHFREVRK